MVIKAVIISSTAVLSRVLLRKRLRRQQWLALAALVAGCLLATGMPSAPDPHLILT